MKALNRWILSQPFPRFELQMLGICVAVWVACAVFL